MKVRDSGQHREREESFIAELCKDVLRIEHSEGDVRAVIHLGKRRDNGSSTLPLIKMNNPEKADIMANVKKLARAEDRFRRINVTRDVTNQQRERIKTAVERAKQSAWETRQRTGHTSWQGRCGNQKC